MARECHRNRVESSAVIILPEETTATGGNVEGDCDRARRAQRSPWRWGAGGTAPEGGHRGGEGGAGRRGVGEPIEGRPHKARSQGERGQIRGKQARSHHRASQAQHLPPTTPVPSPTLRWRTYLYPEIPPLENFLCKSNPSSNNLSGTLQRYGTLFERGVAWKLSRYPPLYRGGRA
jgi:hypothetical protein